MLILHPWQGNPKLVLNHYRPKPSILRMIRYWVLDPAPQRGVTSCCPREKELSVVPVGHWHPWKQ